VLDVDDQDCVTFLSGRTRRVELMRQAFAPEASAAVVVRTALRACLRARLPACRVDDLVLAASELVTNAVTHARTPFAVVLSVCDDRCRLAVTDGSDAVPDRTPHAGPGGFGLVLVSQLTDDWGYDLHPPGKTVWCELRL
jgi:anti-sigma regulatory factor (Ser/Thr protein kinase)